MAQIVACWCLTLLRGVFEHERSCPVFAGRISNCNTLRGYACRSSFDAIDKWRDEFLNQAQPRDPDTFPFVLMGNKIDNQADRKVASRTIYHDARVWTMHFRYPCIDMLDISQIDRGDAETWCADRGGIKYFEVRFTTSCR